MGKTSCPVCYAEMDDNVIECPVCRMPKILIPGDGIDKNNIIRKYADDYTRTLLQDVEIGVYGKKHRAEGDHYVENGTEYVKLFDASDLKIGETVWSQYPFAQGMHNVAFDFAASVKKGAQEKKQTVSCGGLALDDFWYVGVTMEKGMKITFSVGNEKENAKTNAATILF